MVFSLVINFAKTVNIIAAIYKKNYLFYKGINNKSPIKIIINNLKLISYLDHNQKYM